MVRPRIQLERLSGELSRNHYYLHNKSIVAKKVKEMSILTGANILFLGLSPSGSPTLHLGETSDFMDIMRKFSRVSHNDQEKRRHDNIQTLKANYQKGDGYNIEVEKLFQAWRVKKMEGFHGELRMLQRYLNGAYQKKRLLENPKKVMSFQKTMEMQANIWKTLIEVKKRKEKIRIDEERIEAEKFIESTMEPFEDYIPEMLSGNDDLLAYANIMLSENDQASSSHANHGSLIY